MSFGHVASATGILNFRRSLYRENNAVKTISCNRLQYSGGDCDRLWKPRPGSSQLPGTKLTEERARGYARDRLELTDEVSLIVITGCSGDACPTRARVLVSCAYCAIKADELGELLRTNTHCIPEYATQMPLAHTQVGGDGAHISARQPLGGLREARAGSWWV